MSFKKNNKQNNILANYFKKVCKKYLLMTKLHMINFGNIYIKKIDQFYTII